MADEVVGKVIVNVHGDTTPLKQDIRQAAHEAGTGVGNEIAAGIGENDNVTDEITGQIDAAEAPARKSGRKAGKAAAQGMAEGVGDGKLEIDDQIKDIFSDLEQSLRKQSDASSKMVRQQISDAFEVDADQRSQVFERLVGPDLMNHLRTALAKFNAVLQDETGTARIDIDPRALKDAEDEVDRIGYRIRERFEAHGRETTRSFNKGMRKEVSAGIFDAVFKMLALKIGGMGGLFAFGFRAAVPILAGLTAQVGALGASLGAVGAVGAGALATLLPGLAAVKIGFSGMDAEAKKALGDRLKTASGDLQKFKAGVQSELTPALVESVKTLSQLAPEVNAFGRQSAKVAGSLAKDFSKALVGRRAEVKTILDSSSYVMNRIGSALIKLVGPMISALAKMQPLIKRFTDTLANGIEKFAANMDKFVKDGRFEAMMNRWYDRGASLGRAFKNIGIVLVEFFQAGTSSAGDFTKSFEDLTKKWADWAKSIEGQVTLKRIFDEAKPVIKEVWGLLGDIAGLFGESFTGDTGGLVEFIRGIRENVIPGIKDFQEVLRDSGLQDALYGFADALFKLFTAGGGAGAQGFLSVMTSMVSMLGGLLEVVGPVIGPLLGLAGALKAVALTKTLFTGFFNIPAQMFSSLIPQAAEDTTKAVDGITDALDGLDDGDERRTRRRMGRLGRLQGGFGRAVGGIAGAASKAGPIIGGVTTAFFVAQTAAKTFQDQLADPEGAMDSMVEKMKEGKSILEGLAETDIPQGWLTTGISGAADELNGLKEIIKDLGGEGPMQGLNRFLSDMGFDFTGINASKEALGVAFKAIQQYATSTGDWESALSNLQRLQGQLVAGKVPAENYTEALNDAMKAINDVSAVAGSSGAKFTGNLEAGAKDFAFTFGETMQSQIQALYQNPAFVKVATGKLDKEGQAAFKKLLKQYDFTTVNEVSGAISEAAGKQIMDIYVDPKMYDPKKGILTKAGQQAVVNILVDAVPANEKKLEEHIRNMGKIFDTKPLTITTDIKQVPFQITGDEKGAEKVAEIGRNAVKMFVDAADKEADKSIGKLDKEFQTQLGQRILLKRVELQAQGITNPQVIEEILKTETKTILVELETSHAAQAMHDMFGEGFQNKIAAELELDKDGPTKIFKYQGELFKALRSDDGSIKITAMVGADEDAVSKTYGEIKELTDGPGKGLGWTAGVVPEINEDGKSEAEKELDGLSKPRDVLLFPKPQPMPSYVPGSSQSWANTPPSSGYNTGGAGQTSVGTNQQMILVPPAQPAPSMISMGGPTMGGGGGPGISTLAGDIGGGSYDSRGRYATNDPNAPSNKRGDYHVTINNHYPEPEKVSDSIAMSLRVARWQILGA